ncbi:MAG: hypothetical protein EZS28_003379 [Streblomastix strix]|uniref:Uncharacterized protein n=1 Tax=Streblomastix strix TaxID=222440 RepID=A0A5J4X1B7_9EUKA|nr:MAG: hypothetical protein EZS28_003379 [Streblomastix strix]
MKKKMHDFNNYESNYEELFNNQSEEDQDDDEEEVSQYEEIFNNQDEFEYAGEFAYQSGFEFDNNEGMEGEVSGSDYTYEKENGVIQVTEYGEICDTGDIISAFQFGGIRFADDTTLLLALIVRADCQTGKFGGFCFKAVVLISAIGENQFALVINVFASFTCYTVILLQC